MPFEASRLSWCVFHVVGTAGIGYGVDDVWSYGRMGVPLSFVISGFIVPLSMDLAGHKISGYFRFIARRMVRLEPPYFVTIAFILISGVALAHIPQLNTSHPPYTVTNVLLHIGYVNAFVGQPWLSGPFWTLAIEFQYYVVIGLLFPILVSSRTAGLAMLGGFAALSIVSTGYVEFLPPHLSVFGTGILTFMF
ncbi:acyltransferase family protein [Mesorhizobium sp. M1163]|uniref:acyltransferase family protein n=1 Tax=Mesorhizobium sp. M1163 TaxID=2957065 RepID=UPI00333BDA08